jgi:hypothetical protein
MFQIASGAGARADALRGKEITRDRRSLTSSLIFTNSTDPCVKFCQRASALWLGHETGGIWSRGLLLGPGSGSPVFFALGISNRIK